MKKMLVLCVMFFGSASIVNAVCTVEELSAKSTAFQQAAMAFAQKNPKEYREAMLAIAKERDLLEEQKANNMDALCKIFDEYTKKMTGRKSLK